MTTVDSDQHNGGMTSPAVPRRVNRALLSDNEQVERLARLISGQQAWDEIPSEEHDSIIRLSRYHRVFPLLYQAVEPWLHAESPVLQHLQAEALRHKARSVRLAALTQKANQALVDAGVLALWIKGIALAHTLYSHPWLRFMMDVDVLVPDDQSLVALDVLQQAGFENELYQSMGMQLREAEDHRKLIHHFILFSGARDTRIELHYDLAIRRASRLPLAILDWFWEHSHLVRTQVGELQVPTPESGLLLVAMHDFAQHQRPGALGFVPNGLRLYRKYDMSLVMSQSDLDWDLVFRQAAAFGWLDAFWASVRQTHEYFGIPGDFHALDQDLRKQYHLKDDIPLQSTAWHGRYKIAFRLFIRLSIADKLKFFWKRVLFPPAAAVRNTYGLNREQPLWPYYLLRILKKTAEVFRFILTLAAMTVWHRIRTKPDLTRNR